MQVDLNLLTALDALIEHESVQGAAAALHLTPPAMSHTLRRLRVATGDDVLVRNGRNMVATPRAVEIRDEVRELVSRARAVLAPSTALDLPALVRSFTIRGNDALIAALAPALLRDVAETAPGVSIVFLGEQAIDSSDLARGTTDILVSGEQPTTPSVHSMIVGEDRLVVALRREHPLASRSALTLDDFASAQHVVTSRRGRFRGTIDDALAGHGLTRRVLASLPSTAIALDVVRRSDVITVVAEHLAPQDEVLVTRAIPLELPAMAAQVSWHSRYENDPAHGWLRDRVRSHLATALS